MTKKRANGEGSVYKTKNGRVIGSWQDANGKTRYITSKTMTKREMSKAVRKKLRDRDEGIAYDSEGLTVERYMDRCMESIKDRVRPDTFKPYEAIVRLHIKPTLGRTELDKLTAMQLEKLYREKLDAGLSPRRVRYIHVTIRKDLKDAVRLQLLARNVADAAIPPRQSKSEIEPLTQEQMRTLLICSSDSWPLLCGQLAAFEVSEGHSQRCPPEVPARAHKMTVPHTPTMKLVPDMPCRAKTPTMSPPPNPTAPAKARVRVFLQSVKVKLNDAPITAPPSTPIALRVP